jgi:hypothetical protein
VNWRALPSSQKIEIKQQIFRVAGHSVDLPDPLLPVPAADGVFHYYLLKSSAPKTPPMLLEIWPGANAENNLVLWQFIGMTKAEKDLQLLGQTWPLTEFLHTEYLCIEGESEPLSFPHESWLHSDERQEERMIWLLGDKARFSAWLECKPGVGSLLKVL